jgi:hypothetical protein
VRPVGRLQTANYPIRTPFAVEDVTAVSAKVAAERPSRPRHIRRPVLRINRGRYFGGEMPVDLARNTLSAPRGPLAPHIDDVL